MSHLLPEPLQGTFVAILIASTTAALVSAAAHLSMALIRRPTPALAWRMIGFSPLVVTPLIMSALLLLREW